MSTHFAHDYEQGIKDERERIINLLQERLPHLNLAELIEQEEAK